MSSGIKITSDEMRYMALLESVTGAVARDCILDDKAERVIFVVKPGDVGLAIGRKGSNIQMLRRMTNRNIEVVEYAESPVEFIKNTFAPAQVREVRITEKSDGKKIAVVTVEPRDKGVAIGKNGKNADRTRFLAKRYFEIDHVIIT